MRRGVWVWSLPFECLAPEKLLSEFLCPCLSDGNLGHGSQGYRGVSIGTISVEECTDRHSSDSGMPPSPFG